MKKGFLIVLLTVLISPVFSQNIPQILQGIWEGKDRFVFFENAADDKNPELVVVLKEYYGWYYDRAAEPDAYSEIEPRTRNAATHKDPEIIPYTINTLNAQNDASNAFQINISYSKHNSDTTTFAVIDDKIFLNVYILLEDKDAGDSKLYRSYQHSEGFLMYEQPTDQNISLLIVDNDKYYDVRYWYTDMDYDPSYVTFKYKDDVYSVPKHLQADGSNYSCVNGRSKKVRNTMPSFSLSASCYYFDETKTVLIPASDAYLTKVTDSNTLEALFKIIQDANSRRKPDPEPIFPVTLPKFPGSDD